MPKAAPMVRITKHQTVRVPAGTAAQAPSPSHLQAVGTAVWPPNVQVLVSSGPRSAQPVPLSSPSRRRV